MGVGARREGDAGEHAIDRSANGVSDGYVLGDGKMNVFRDADTLSEGLQTLENLVRGVSRLLMPHGIDR
jgi:hypothetical protein